MLAAMAEDSGTSKSTFEVYENDGELTIGFSDDWVGRGGGDRTHDLRLKRPLLYH